MNPHGLRVGVIKNWDSRWYAGKEYADYLLEDYQIRTYLKKKLYAAGISRFEIERAANRVKVNIFTAKPGIVIGRGGAEVEVLRQELEKMTGKKVNININEVKRPELDAQLVAESVAAALEKRIAFRRAMKQTVGRTMRMGAEGIKIMCSGRLGGAEIARSEWYSEGKVPLHTLRADIDYATAEADTTYGKIGVKVWIYKGEIRLNGDPTYVINQYLNQVALDHQEEVKKAIEEGTHRATGIVTIDAPKDFSEINQNDGKFLCRGWEISNSLESITEIYIDDKKLDSFKRYPRKDVFDIYKEDYAGFLDVNRIGWNFYLELNKLEKGKHRLVVKTFMLNGQQLASNDVEFTIADTGEVQKVIMKDQPKTTVVKTGDNSQTGLYLAVMAMVGIAVLVISRKSKKKDGDMSE